MTNPEQPTHSRSGRGMCARSDSDPVQPEDRGTDLTVTDEFGKEQQFHCEGCRSFWVECGPHGKNPGHCRSLDCIERQLNFMSKERDGRDIKWKRLWKIIIHLLTAKDLKKVSANNCENENVTVQQFITMVMRFGCVKKQENGECENSCFMLQEVQRIIKKAGAQNGKKMLSWFAGHMSKSAAEERLMKEPEGTFLVRCSETHADKGGFSVGVKTKDGVNHYLIFGVPERMDDDGEYNNRFHLCMDGVDEDQSYPNLIRLIDDRCKHQMIEGDICF